MRELSLRAVLERVGGVRHEWKWWDDLVVKKAGEVEFPFTERLTK